MLVAHLRRVEREAEGRLEVLVWGSSSILHTSLHVSRVIDGAASWLIMSLRYVTVRIGSIMPKEKKKESVTAGPGRTHWMFSLLPHTVVDGAGLPALSALFTSARQ